jgi:vitamin B12 transporter
VYIAPTHIVKKIITILAFIVFAKLCFAQTKTVDTVIIVTDAKLKTISTVVPTQTILSSSIQQQNISNIADALKQFAGVQVKDYGGAAGLKTISVRSLGANHTGFLYDGMAIADAQGGQIDFGRFAIDNLKQISLYNAQPENILLPAKAFNYSSIVVATTKANQMLPNKKLLGQVSINLASFNNVAANIFLQKKLSNIVQSSFLIWGQTAKNNFPFVSLEKKDSSTTRQNSFIDATKLEYDLVAKKNDSNSFQLKAFYYQSKRGLPGSVILYNNNVTQQTLVDKNFFIQSQLTKYISKNTAALVSLKYAADNIVYVDKAYPNNLGYFKNDFNQNEFYASAAVKNNITKQFAASLSTDYSINTLSRKDIFDANFASPNRQTFLQNFAASFTSKYLQLQGSTQYIYTKEKVKNGNAAKSYQNFMPTILAQVKPIDNNPLMFRFFYKEIYRIPTFNDLYFTNIGNTNLRPELAQQFNIGAGYSITQKWLFKQIQATADFYVNKVTDKILAIPRQNLFQWSMQNIGSVNIKGLDAKLQVYFQEFNGINLFYTQTYSYQQALDITDNTSDSYNKQLAYTPEHNFNSNITASYKKLSLSYALTGTSIRYTQGIQSFENSVQPFALHDIAFAYLTSKNTRLKVELNNAFNTNYQIVQYYPMPARNYRLQLQINF